MNNQNPIKDPLQSKTLEELYPPTETQRIQEDIDDLTRMIEIMDRQTDLNVCELLDDWLLDCETDKFLDECRELIDSPGPFELGLGL